ncbi:MAG: ATP synthase subunit I [Bradyrhizobium sp.]
MTSLALNNLPNWATLLSLVAHLAAGIVVGVLYFRSLWWNARRFTTGGRVSTTIAVMIGRFVILGMILTLARSGRCTAATPDGAGRRYRSPGSHAQNREINHDVAACKRRAFPFRSDTDHRGCRSHLGHHGGVGDRQHSH